MDERFHEALERSISGASSDRGVPVPRTDGVTPAAGPAPGTLSASCHALDRARSLGGVLDSLVASAACVADRAALFVVRAGRLRVWRLHGFGSPPAATATREAAQVRTSPVLVGGRVVAVLHGEAVRPDEGSTAADGWPEMLDVLACHAGRVLESMTLHQVLGLTAPRLGKGRIG